MTIKEIKVLRRKEIYGRLKQVTVPERDSASHQVATAILLSPAWQQARQVLLYAPLPDELDLWPVVMAALAAGKTVALPAFDPGTRRYVAKRIADPVRDIVVGHYGIREPGLGCENILLNQLDLCLAPGLGYNKARVRLGRGAGYYDRLLAGFTGQKWGVGYDWQTDLDFPQEDHDVIWDCIWTPAGWRG